MPRGVKRTAPFIHGTEDCYVNGHCRRPECRKAASRGRKIRRLITKDQAIPLRVPIHGSRRRLQALATLGWSLPMLERYAKVTPDTFIRISKLGAWVTRSTAELISRLYDELWDQEPPRNTLLERQVTGRQRGIAKRNGWAPPMAWAGIDMDDPEASPRLDADEDEGEIFDWVKVERAVSGWADVKDLTRAEKEAAAEGLIRRGFSRQQIIAKLHTSGDLVNRVIASMQQAA